MLPWVLVAVLLVMACGWYKRQLPLPASVNHRLRQKLTPRAMTRLRRGPAFVTALILVWRLHGTLPAPLNAPRPEASPPIRKLPSCCPAEPL